MATAFENFVNGVLGKVLQIADIPPSGNVEAGKFPRYTGVGFNTEAVDFSTDPIGSIRVGTSFKAQYATVQEAYAYAKTDPTITLILIEPGTYNEIGYLDITTSTVYFQGVDLEDEFDQPVLNFSDASKSVLMTGNVRLYLRDCYIRKINPITDHTVVVIDGGVGDIPIITCTGTSGLGILRMPAITAKLRIVERLETAKKYAIQIHLQDNANSMIFGLNYTDSTGTAKLFEIKYDDSTIYNSGADVFEIQSDAGTSGIYLRCKSTVTDVVLVDYDWLYSLDLKNAWVRIASSSTQPSIKNVTYFKTNCYKTLVTCNGSLFDTLDIATSPTANSEKITIFDCPTVSTGSSIYNKQNQYFTHPGTIENNICKNLQNSIVVDLFNDIGAPDVTISRDGDASEILRYSVLDGAGKYLLSDGIIYTPDNSTHWSGDPATIRDAVDRMASLLYTLNGNSPIP